MTKQATTNTNVTAKRVSNTEFVLAYMKAVEDGKGLKQLATELGIPRNTVGGKIHRLRTKGVQLPRMAATVARDGASVDELNALITGYKA